MSPGAGRIILVFAGSIVCLSLGNILLAVGTRAFGTQAPHGFLAVVRALVSAWQLPLGIVLMILQFVGMLSLFGWGLHVSVVVPVFGLNYVATALLGQLMLGEPVTSTRWLGIALVLCGVALIARGAEPQP